MNKLTDRSGMALIIVLTMSMFLLVIAVSYIRGNAQSRPINERHFERAQADFLGQGVVQFAAMKFKKRPAEFYYAYRAMRAGLGDAALRAYLNDDTTLNNEFVDQEGQRYEYFTQMQLITNKLYETDGIRIQVTVNQLSDTGTIVLTRVQEHVIEAKRRPL
ncbi:MAG: hypothetical protein A2W80_06760 [Candidatus Riflebacteria bacterium GWC2_50_8]|nr:MAG: hypothetical protein A2W80_06760 [Candidatus Riflebacteria bacterium GWC2_50_8]